MQQNVKSATTAGLLGIFLGAFGAHNWYLGDKKKGIIHVALMGGGILVYIVTGIIVPNVLSFSAFMTAATILGILGGIASLAMAASGIWGFVEGIMILTQGDAGLAAKGYAVANPAMQNQPMQGYAQPMTGYAQPMQGYGQMSQQPMNQPMQGYGQMPQQPMNQPMQGYNGQPMMQNMNQPTQMQPMPGYNQMPGQPMGQPMSQEQPVGPMNVGPITSGNENGGTNGQ